LLSRRQHSIKILRSSEILEDIFGVLIQSSIWDHTSLTSKALKALNHGFAASIASKVVWTDQIETKLTWLDNLEISLGTGGEVKLLLS
jgi:hypothetical protein